MKKVVSVLVVLGLVSLANGTNLVPNGGFESWTNGTPDGWTIGGAVVSGYPLQEGSDVNEGAYSAEWKWSAQDNGININDMSKSAVFTLTPGQEYVLSATYKPLPFTSTGKGEVELFVGIVGPSSGNYWGKATDNLLLWYGHNETEPAVGDDYTTVSLNFTWPDTTGAARIFIFNRYWRGARLLIDPIEVRAVPEPATLLIIASGCFGVMCRSRDRR